MNKSRSGVDTVDPRKAYSPVPVDTNCEHITKPKLIQRVEPKYPEAVRRSRVAGVVIVEGIIGLDGAVSDPLVLSSPSPELTDLVLEAFLKWRYSPAICDDLSTPIRVYVTVTSDFKIK